MNGSDVCYGSGYSGSPGWDSFATRCISAGMKPKTLQTILGHASIDVTMDLYVHTSEEDKFKELDKVSKLLNVV